MWLCVCSSMPAQVHIWCLPTIILERNPAFILHLWLPLHTPRTLPWPSQVSPGGGLRQSCWGLPPGVIATSRLKPHSGPRILIRPLVFSPGHSCTKNDFSLAGGRGACIICLHEELQGRQAYSQKSLKQNWVLSTCVDQANPSRPLDVLACLFYRNGARIRGANGH